MDVREKLVELLNEFYGCDPMYFGVDALAIAKELIANGVTVVVRCKDCKHWHKDTVFCDYMSYREASERVNWYADDFCSYGERKEDK